MSNITGWPRGLEVPGGGQGVVSHAGLVLLRHLAGKTGLAGGLSRALASPRVLVCRHADGVVPAGASRRLLPEAASASWLCRLSNSSKSHTTAG